MSPKFDLLLIRSIYVSAKTRLPCQTLMTYSLTKTVTKTVLPPPTLKRLDPKFFVLLRLMKRRRIPTYPSSNTVSVPTSARQREGPDPRRGSRGPPRTSRRDLPPERGPTRVRIPHRLLSCRRLGVRTVIVTSLLCGSLLLFPKLSFWDQTKLYPSPSSRKPSPPEGNGPLRILGERWVRERKRVSLGGVGGRGSLSPNPFRSCGTETTGHWECRGRTEESPRR